MPTLGAVLDAYIAKYEPVLFPATVRDYQVTRCNRFQAYMGWPVDSIDWQNMLHVEIGYMVGAKTLKNAWGVVHTALEDSGYLIPTVKLPPVPAKEIPFFQPEEISPFVIAMEGDLADIPALLMPRGL